MEGLTELQALVTSLTTALATQAERAADLDQKLHKAEAELEESRRARSKCENECARLRADLGELQRTHEETSQRVNDSMAETEALRDELIASQGAIARAGMASDTLHSVVCTLLLQAHEWAPPKMEAPRSAVDASEPQAVLQANFEAVLGAYNAACQQTEELALAIREMAAPMGAFRSALLEASSSHVRNFSGPSRSPSTPGYERRIQHDTMRGMSAGNGTVEESAEVAGEREWRERVRQQRRKEMEADAIYADHEASDHGGSPNAHTDVAMAPALTADALKSVAEAMGCSTSGGQGRWPTVGESRANGDYIAARLALADALEDEEAQATIRAEASGAAGEAVTGANPPAAATATMGSSRASTFEVVLPEQARAGDTLFVTLPNGGEVEVVVPPGVPPGSVLTCSTSGSTCGSTCGSPDSETPTGAHSPSGGTGA